MAHTEIKLRRTKLDINTTTQSTKDAINKERLVFGEALVANTNKYLLVGGDDTSVLNTELPRVRLLDKTIVDDVIYHDGNTLKDLDNETINPTTKAANVTSTYKSNVEAALNDLGARTAKISNRYYAGSTSDGGAANTVKSAAVTSGTLYVTGVTAANAATQYNTSVSIDAANGILKGAAWNDFAEFRVVEDIAEPGHCVVENGDGTLSRSTKRLQPGASIISDTYGMIIGDSTDKHAKALAVAGRVLAYADRADDLHPGDAVCSDEFGLVSKMSRLEIILHPDAIIGYISEIPTYDFWNNVPVKGRIWIKLK